MTNLVDSDKLTEFKERINSMSNGAASKICIFGAGKLGFKLFKELRNRLVNVDFFCDNDTGKYGYISDNKYCISLEELVQYKDEILVIISPAKGIEDIESQLSKLGFKFIIKREEIEKIMEDIPRVHWFDGLENIDYSSKEMELVISRFKEIIFDICCFYESELNKK